MPRKPTKAEQAAISALFAHLPKSSRRLMMQMTWQIMPRSQRRLPSLRAARPFAPSENGFLTARKAASKGAR